MKKMKVDASILVTDTLMDGREYILKLANVIKMQPILYPGLKIYINAFGAAEPVVVKECWYKLDSNRVGFCGCVFISKDLLTKDFFDGILTGGWSIVDAREFLLNANPHLRGAYEESQRRRTCSKTSSPKRSANLPKSITAS